MSENLSVAVVGASSLVGEALVQLLEERKFALVKLYLLDHDGAAGGRVEFRGSNLKIEALSQFDFAKVRLAFFCAGREIADAYAEKAVMAGCIVIDSSPCFRADVDVPLVVADVNPEALEGAGPLIASPSCAAMEVAMALRPIRDAADLERLNVVTLQSVSGAGRAAVEELARQTAMLLNARPIEPALFPKQIAFNVLPQVDVFLDDGHTREELKLAAELRRVLELPELAINTTAVRVPVFFGHGAVVHLETIEPLSADLVRDLLAAAPGVEVLDTHEPGGYPTPVTEAAGQDPVWVGRVREDLSHPRGLNLWIVTENIRGQALNCVKIAEQLAKKSPL